MNIYFSFLKIITFILLDLLISSIAFAVVRVNVALPIGYYVDPKIGTDKYLNADKVIAHPDKFYCLDNRVCNADKKTVYEGITLTVEHKFASTAVIGGAAWFDIRNSYSGKYVTSCEVLGYGNIRLAQVFCYVPINGELKYPWSIVNTTIAQSKTATNPHFQIFFAPVSHANEERNTLKIYDNSLIQAELLNSTCLQYDKAFTNFFEKYPGVVRYIPSDYENQLCTEWWNDTPLIAPI